MQVAICGMVLLVVGVFVAAASKAGVGWAIVAALASAVAFGIPVSVAQANIAAWQAQLQVLNQQKAYQSVVAPFDGVVTQRNVDVGDLMQADAASGTFMFSVMQSDVLRVFVYVPQDQAFGLAPGVA